MADYADLESRLRACPLPNLGLPHEAADAIATLRRERDEAWQESRTFAANVAEREKVFARSTGEQETRAEAAESRIAALEAESVRLRAALANSQGACVYCSLPRDEWSKCKSGFPGCARADDAVGCPELGARMEVDELKLENARVREALLQCVHWFQDSAAGHSNKGDVEKAQRNQDRADYARAALGASHE